MIKHLENKMHTYFRPNNNIGHQFRFFFSRIIEKNKFNFQELITPQYQMRAHREDVRLFDSQEYSTILLRTVVLKL